MAALDRDDQDYATCVDLFTGLHLARRQVLVPGPVIAEAGYLLQRQGGTRVEADFLRSFAERTFDYVGLEPQDFARMVELVETYADFPLGTTDAAVITVAERLGVAEIATLDHRHFRAIRPRHISAFTLLP